MTETRTYGKVSCNQDTAEKTIYTGGEEKVREAGKRKKIVV